LEPTSTALPAASASSITCEDVIPLLPSAGGQSLGDITRTGLTSHQIGPVLTLELSTTWLWLGVGTNTLTVGGPVFPVTFNRTEMSTEDACIVHVPGAAFGSGHCVKTAGWVLHASGTKPNRPISVFPRVGPQSSPGLGSVANSSSKTYRD
jgi:hypothetical protein